MMRVIGHVDNDAFYCQVEVKRDPDRLAGQPVVVIQYNPFGDLSTLRPDDDRLRPESNGSIIAVSYEARRYGVKRNMMAQQAKKLCPNLQIVQVPVAHGKADLTIYRDAGAAVVSILSKSGVCERASIDEAYIDVTTAAQQLLADAKRASRSSRRSASPAGVADTPAPAGAWTDAVAGDVASDGGFQSDDELQELADDLGVELHVLPTPDSFEGWHVAGLDCEGREAVHDWWSRPAASWTQSDALLAAGALVVARARAAVKASLGFSCSAGIAHSKILAKLGSGLNKPAQQTVVPAAAVSTLLAPLPLTKLRQLGGKFGEEVMAKLKITTVGELAAVPLPRLEAAFGVQDAAWLSQLAQGKDGDEVKPRMLPKSISCGKTFRGQNVLTSLTAVHDWLLELGRELQERIEADRQQHQRLPKLLTVSFDSAPLQEEAGPNAGTAGVHGNAGSVAAGPSSSNIRLNAQNWRAGASNISRSCALRHPRADAMAVDALGLVKKWARDRPDGFLIVTMFMSVSNFSLAPTGASTLDRFLASSASAPAAVGSTFTPAAAAAAAATGQSAALQEGPDLQQTQHTSNQAAAAVQSSAAEEQHTAQGTASRLSTQAGSLKRAPAGLPNPGMAKRAARSGRQQGDLRAFLAAGAAASKAGAASKASASSAAAAAPAAAPLAPSLANAHMGSHPVLLQDVPAAQSLLYAGRADSAAMESNMVHRDARVRVGGLGSNLAPEGPTAAAAAAAAVITPSAAMAEGTSMGLLLTTQPVPVKPALPALSAWQSLGCAGLQGHPQAVGPDVQQVPAAAGAATFSAAASPAASTAVVQSLQHCLPTAGDDAPGLPAQPLPAVRGFPCEGSDPCSSSQISDAPRQVAALHTWLGSRGQQGRLEQGQLQEEQQTDRQTLQQLSCQGTSVEADRQGLAALPVLVAAGDSQDAQQQHVPVGCLPGILPASQQEHEQQQQCSNPACAAATGPGGPRGLTQVVAGSNTTLPVSLVGPAGDAAAAAAAAAAAGSGNAGFGFDAAASMATPASPQQHQDGHGQGLNGQPPGSSQASWVPEAMQLTSIDQDVMAALPWDIQMEVQQQLRHSRNIASRGRAGAAIRGRGRRSLTGSAGSKPKGQHVPTAAGILKYSKK